MINPTTYNVAIQGEQMRSAQKLYFQLAAVARNTKLPADWAAASNQLKISMQFEKVFDATIHKIMEEAYPSQL